MPKPRRRIVFLNRSYWPDIEATGQLLTDLCRGLAERFDVHVVCGQPNSPEADSSYLQAGAESRDGVTIHRLTHYQFAKKNPFGRILNLLSFYWSARRFLRRVEWGADVVVSETDPFLMPIAGAEFAKRVGAEHCVYLQDIYPDVAEAVGKVRVPGIAPLLRRKLRATYKDASRIIVLGRCMRKRLTNAPWGIHRDRIEIVPNWSDCQEIAPIDHRENEFRIRHGLSDAFVVMHSGNMGLTQRLEMLITAAAQPNWPERAKLVLVGNGASRDKLLEHSARLNLPSGRVEFVYYQPRTQLAESLSAADLHVVSMHEKVTGCLCPSKLYGIMAAGRGVLAIADPQTDLCQTIRERDLGWCVRPGSASAIADAVAEAEAESRRASSSDFVNRQRRARHAAIRDFDRPVIVKRFAQILSSILSDHAIDLGDHDLHGAALSQNYSASDSGIALSL
ncbi:putative glycosyl transferase [Stieleria maiorica]|uniref:Putative glycosyl transferase n=1 Tax=Stieleria maiorica TaxID=2795974 RepID=A0A5B9MHF6_9BACT|nr:glycosyltransferase family 4 protein [Stieleria maiorica]QEF99496.1 putative glycosyl transferase [Stieleria maiorica]